MTEMTECFSRRSGRMSSGPEPFLGSNLDKIFLTSPQLTPKADNARSGLLWFGLGNY